MAERLVERRRFMWRINNFSRINQPDANEWVTSDSFEISLGANKTKWHFGLNPANKNEPCGVNIIKDSIDAGNFKLSLSVAIRSPENHYMHQIQFEVPANDIVAGKSWGRTNFLTIGHILKEPTKYLVDDTLMLVIDLKIHQNESPREIKHNALSDVVVSMFNSKNFSDITLVCSDRKELQAHRCVLINRSPVFKDMLTTSHKREDRLVMRNIDSETMNEILRYIYTNEVENLDKLCPKLINAAKRYDLEDLKSMCISKLRPVTKANVFKLLVLAHAFDEKELLVDCMEFIHTNFQDLQSALWWKKIQNELILTYLRHVEEASAAIIPLCTSL